jgi:hypothetical protein
MGVAYEAGKWRLDPLEFVLIARTFQVDVLDTIRREPAAEPLHEGILASLPNYVWHHYTVPAPARAIDSALQ